jgi:hypothetical protein
LAKFNTNFFLNIGDNLTSAWQQPGLSHTLLMVILTMVGQSDFAHAKPIQAPSQLANSASGRPVVGASQRNKESERASLHTKAENHYRHKRCQACYCKSATKSIKKFPNVTTAFYVTQST